MPQASEEDRNRALELFGDGEHRCPGAGVALESWVGSSARKVTSSFAFVRAVTVGFAVVTSTKLL